MTVPKRVFCRICGAGFSFEITEEQERLLSLPRQERPNMQNILPALIAGERELFISGTCSACWDEMFPEEEEENS